MKSCKPGAGQEIRHTRRWVAMLALAAAGVLSACGGGTQQIDPFVPTRIIALGDEASAITAAGKKYTINGLDATTGLLSCATNPNWVQILAGNFGLVFKECNPTNIATPTGIMYAAAGVKVADVRARIDAHFANGSFGPKDLVTVMAGTNDVLELYNQYPAQSSDSLLAEARARGKLLAQQVNRIADANGRVIVAVVPDVGLTPFAVKEAAAKPGALDRAKFLSSLTEELNLEMTINLKNDGRLIGLVKTNDDGSGGIQTIVKFASGFGFANVTAGACLTTVDITDCTTKTLVTDATVDTWLWANDVQLSPAGHQRLGSLALVRARNNPF
ncbi:MAG: SGNH/GDSL hydrolase family protein [Paucibacter sp.]|nr:SGNH/GDSL hydrolase family protein [Roseateles sp.]